MNEILKPDDDLIRQLKSIGSGADIHWILGRIGYYRSCAHLYNENPEQFGHYKDEFEKLEQLLRTYLVTKIRPR